MGVIGYGVTVGSVEARRFDEGFLAVYRLEDRIQTNWDGVARTSSIAEDRLGRSYGAECLIDRIDRICREHPDPWEAAPSVTGALDEELRELYGADGRAVQPPVDSRRAVMAARSARAGETEVVVAPHRLLPSVVVECHGGARVKGEASRLRLRHHPRADALVPTGGAESVPILTANHRYREHFSTIDHPAADGGGARLATSDRRRPPGGTGARSNDFYDLEGWPWKRYAEALPAWLDELGRGAGLERPRMDPAEFLSRSCELLGTTTAAIAGPGKGREISRERYLIVALGIERWGMTAKPLAGLVGRLPEAVSRWGSRGAEMRQESENFREAYKKLDRDLATHYKRRK